MPLTAFYLDGHGICSPNSAVVRRPRTTMPKRSAVARWSACAVLLLLASGVQPAPAAGAAGRDTPPSAWDFTVFAFSQSDVDQEDPQVYQLAPDVNIRA